MVVSPAPADAELTTSTSEDPPGPAVFRLVVLIVLVVVIVVATAVASFLLVPRSGDDSGDTQASREEVMAQTEQFMLRLGTYGPELLDDKGAMPDYREKVKEVITPKFAASFEDEAGTAEQLVAQAGVSRVPDVFATGVASIDEDSAKTLVAGSFSDTYAVDGKKIKQEPIPFRIEVSLVKIDGTWLVDDFSPVSAAEEEPK